MTGRRRAGAARSTAAGGVVIVLAVWLACAPSLWRYDGVAPGFDAQSNDLVVAAVLGGFGIAWSLGLLPGRSARVVGTVLGGWLIMAPLVLDYGVVTDSTMASVNDMVVGAAVISLTFLADTTRELSRERARPRRHKK